MTGLVPAIHAAAPQRRVGRRRGGSQRLDEQRFFYLASSFRSFSAPQHVDGRDKPGHDASGPSRSPNIQNFLAANT
jgi:hypothetical protein